MSTVSETGAGEPIFYIDVTDVATEADKSVIGAGLNAFNQQQAGPYGGGELTVLVRDANGRAIGGLLGWETYRWLHVSTFHLPPSLRGSGVGARVLAAAEQAARNRRCLGVYLDTFSFQAPGFYAKHGYEPMGVIEDFPPGHSRHFFKKRLAMKP